jgi:hypothetical protein
VGDNHTRLRREKVSLLYGNLCCTTTLPELAMKPISLVLGKPCILGKIPDTDSLSLIGHQFEGDKLY